MQRSSKIEQTVIMLDTGGFAGETFVSGFGGFAQEDSYTASTHPVPNSQSGKPILPFHNCTSLMSSLVCGSLSCGGFPWTSHMQVCN
jgi:hypothetical protein